MYLFYRAVLDSLIRYGIQSLYGNLSVQLKPRLACLVQTAMRIMEENKEQQSLQPIYEQSVLRGAQRILADPCHVLYSEYELLPSGSGYSPKM